jgi:hypothetical protein
MRPLWIVLVVAVMLAAFAGAADAQPAPKANRKPPTQKQLDQARQHFEAAEAAKARHEYQTAALEYLAAYEQFQEPEFFYNVAEVYRLGGDEPNALSYYEKYLELDPSGRGAATARDSAAQLRRSIAAKQDALARAAAQEAKDKEEAERKRNEVKPAVVAPAPVRPAEHPGRSLQIAGIAAGGAGVVALGVGVAFGFKMKGIEDEISKDTVYRPSRYDDGRAAERNMFVFTGVGIAAVAAGGVMYYLGHSAARSGERNTGPAVTLAPLVGPDQVALAAMGSF